MIHQLSVTNSHIYLDEDNLLEVLKNYPQKQIQPDLYVYTVTEVMFCSISGVLMVYVDKGDIRELVFNCYDAISIFNIPNTPSVFSQYKNTLIEELTQKYREKSEENQFFNRNFDFTVTASDNNISVLIKRRTI